MANPPGESTAENQAQEENMMIKHIAFFDRNHDGTLYPRETFEGLQAIGCGTLLSLVSAVAIHVGLSRKTRPGKYPSVLFPIEVNNIALAKHGSDTGVYDEKGRFVQAKFDEIFSKHAHLNKNGLNFLEVQFMLMANRKDFLGWLAAMLEWNILYFLCQKNGLLSKDTIRGVYDGSLFVQMENEHKTKNAPKNK